jgi:hypothetical protein
MVDQTVIVWAEDEDRSGAETGLAAISDPILFQTGDLHEIPTKWTWWAGFQPMTEFAAYPLQYVRLNSPNINGKGINNLRLTRSSAGPTKALNYNDHGAFPFPGVPGNVVTAFSLEDDEAGVAHYNSMSAFLATGPIGPFTPKPITHMPEVTVAATGAAVTWKQDTPTLTDALPHGTYRLWGARFISATAIACRFILPGVNHRPAVPVVRNEEDTEHPFARAINPAGYVFNHKGNTMDITMEYMAAANETPGKCALYLQKIG